ncbi:CHASE2 domain-containing protein [Paraburkholderia silviterrae]|uniref:CHASE2 domain-containing protein n=1 Tax=Paraburkholderia silviterrae TaxID=2528715 RepID=A0A4R5M4L6_9BURK|nr:CHASE2 domain-containing protein [Paraburkholderia silviterrae]TDG20753.1 CHASE2 domain-containing protein [Paraburkholderia silviterrae]
MSGQERGTCAPGERDRAARIKRTILQAVLAIVLGIAGALVLPRLFGEEFATRQAARVYAPVAGKAYGAGSREGISVLLIDDAALAQAGQSWPASYGYYARLLRGVEIYRPRAVFFDIAFKDARPDPTLAQFAQRLCALSASGTKVYLAATPGADGALRLRPDLDELRGRCFEPVAVTYAPDEVDKLAWSYPLEQRGANEARERSAALAIHDDLSAQPIADPRVPMAVSWGLVPAHDGLRWFTQEQAGDAARESGARSQEAQSYCRADHGLAEILPFGVRERLYGDAEKPVCVFHETVYAYDLANTDDAGEAMLEHALNNRVVMIGTARQFSSDYINSPIHGRIPGVYLHAMALDNLDTYGANYKHVAALALSTDRDHLCLFALVFGAVLVVALVRILKNLTRKEAQRQKLSFSLSCALERGREFIVWLVMCGLEFVCSLVLVGALLYVGQAKMDIGFLSIVDIAVFALAAEWFEWNERLVEWLLGPEPSAGEGGHDHPHEKKDEAGNATREGGAGAARPAEQAESTHP